MDEELDLQINRIEENLDLQINKMKPKNKQLIPAGIRGMIYSFLDYMTLLNVV